jgi:hypothetical protein
MAWMYLLAAGLLEIVWAYTMKLSQGFSRPGPTALTILVMLASFALLSLSMKTLPLGTATDDGTPPRGCAHRERSERHEAVGCRLV